VNFQPSKDVTLLSVSCPSPLSEKIPYPACGALLALLPGDSFLAPTSLASLVARSLLCDTRTNESGDESGHVGMAYASEEGASAMPAECINR